VKIYRHLRPVDKANSITFDIVLAEEEQIYASLLEQLLAVVRVRSPSSDRSCCILIGYLYRIVDARPGSTILSGFREERGDRTPTTGTAGLEIVHSPGPKLVR
jgi:hypothetical protein